MDSSFSASSRRSYDIPKPETGLAEWTSKIKALQREVDADEETEQKRLEEEISAARQARLRRSRGTSRAGSADMSSTKDQLQNFDSPNDTSANDTPKSVAERANDQETALRKLMGRNDVYNPDKINPSTRTTGGSSNTQSLAAFIGGRATGPRLNRHAPQQDAHDPAQFVRPDISAPHPVFGKGGIAMPGMATRNDSKSASSAIGSELSERYQPSSAKTTPLKSPPAATVYQHAETIPKPNKQDSFDTVRRSFTSKDSTPSPELSTNITVKSASFNDISNRTHNESPFQSNQNIDSAASKTLPFTSFTKGEPNFKGSSPLPSKPADTFASVVTPSSKPLPSYLGTINASKPLPSTNSQKKTEPTSNTAQTPLRRLMETNNVYNPDKSETTRKTIAERAQGVSLAGFMGGSAGGPRLNRHAPQPDAHDPTQFIQPDTSAPHPIFGRGGIAMPGLASRKEPDPVSGSENAERYRPSSGTKAIWPPVQTSYTEKLRDERPVSPQKTGSRERTSSAPGSRPPIMSNSFQSGNWPSPATSYTQAGRHSPTKEIQAVSPVRDRTISGPSKPQVTTPFSTPSLARPIQPMPKTSSTSPLIPGIVSSPAFQKPNPSKDLTPSISRLQGRGFVQSMVKVSSQLDISPSASPASASADRSRPPSASGKKGSVLDRWQPHMQSPSPTQSSAPSFPVRRSTTQEPTSHVSSPRISVSSSTNQGAPHTLKSVASLPSLAKPTSTISPKSLTEESNNVVELYRPRTPGLGSATTMVLIKPSKSATDLKRLTHVDELGVKHDSGQGTSANVTPSSKKPLIHPTKDRARKPKKSADPQNLEDSVRANLEKGTLNLSSEEREASFSRPWSRTQVSEPVNPVQEEKQPSAFAFELFTSTKPPSYSNINNTDDTPNYQLTTTEDPISPEFLSGTKLDFNGQHELNSFALPVRKSASAPSSPMVASFGKLTHTSSTGSRPTVMEVAQALQDQVDRVPSSLISNDTKNTAHEASEIPSKLRGSLSQIQAEKRRSTYEKYSAIILPPLKEEATPTPTPAGTLNLRGIHLVDVKTSIPDEIKMVVDDPRRQAHDKEGVTTPNVLYLTRNEKPLPAIEVVKFLKHPFPVPTAAPDQQIISVEVLLLTGTSTAPIAGPTNIFYESEILTIIHRIKSTSSGLASTFVWCWLGRRSSFGDREERKLHDLGKRYGTSAKIVHQLAEPPELVQILGGTLAVRQGTRTHWSSDNTTMHLVRSLNGVIFIDEHDLNIKNLCSAFSYCLTILGSIYVWHGCGSTFKERHAAVKYAKQLSNDTASPAELLEGETDNDEMFWMILGDDDFAKADYWKWRKGFSSGIDPIIWRVEPDNTENTMHPVQFISLETQLQASVYVINCVWELFVFVCKDARSNRRVIRFALDVATTLSKEVASARPYAPTVHALALPSQIPSDLRLGIRDFDEAWLNNGDIPDHMNLLSFSEAAAHLSKESWGPLALKDHDMLPLGVGLTDISESEE